MRRILTLALITISLLKGSASAINTKFFEDYGAERQYSARVSAISSHTVTGIMTAWSVTAVGGSADFQIKHSTTYVQSDTNPAPPPEVNTSSTMYVLSGGNVKGVTRGIVTNPTIFLSRIDQPGATVYIIIDYLAPRQPGEF